MKTKKAKRTYSKISSLAWALGKLWRLDKRLLLLAFTMAPVSIALSLLASYFSKVLIDSIGGGAPFSQLLTLVVSFTAATLVLQVLRAFLHTRCAARRYYPTDVYQREMSVFQQYETDYENTEKQDFNEIAGYAWTDASAGNCSLEFIWEDLSNTWNHLLGIVTYTSLLVALHPLIFAVVIMVSVLSYSTSALDPIAEAEIYAKFDEIVGDKTAIYISHRLSSCRFCDRIAVFDQGQIVQIGTHEELLADETGKYHELWYAQAQYYTEQ